MSIAPYWTDEEIATLCRLHRQRVSIAGIAGRLGRSEKGVRLQVTKLRADGLIPPLKQDSRHLPIPEGVEQMMRNGASNRAVGKVFGKADTTAAKWRKRLGLPAYDRWASLEPAPADFAKMAPRLTRHGLSVHYNRGDPVIGRWLAETRTEPKRWTFNKGQVAPSSVPQADSSLVGRAMMFLQKQGQVFRCSVRPDMANKLPDKGKHHFSLWGTIVNESELIAKAIAKGFDPDEWRRV